ncbi:Leucine-rich repeat domain, L domain-like [Phytophthora cactorum]|nr:Leucine-rich repeat domain, L domain-like [Phytophthora cactorum]
MTVRRTEELQEWICSVTATANDHGEHLSVMLRDGQLLCLLANGVDPTANLKVNKLNTVFHSKANIRLFLEWCKKQGLNEGEIFQPDELLDAGADFGTVLETLSILFDRFGTIGYTGEYEEDPVSDAESMTSTGSSQGTSPVKKTNSNNKLTNFMKGGFLSRKKKSSKKVVDKPPRERPHRRLHQCHHNSEREEPPAPKPQPTVRRPPSPKQPPKSQPTGGDARNKFAAFMKSNPPAVETTPAAGPYAGSGGSNLKSSVSPTAGDKPLPRPSLHLSEVNAPAGGRSAPKSTYNAPTPSTPTPFKPRHMIERSTGRGNYVRKRQTYWVPPKRRRSNFSLEKKRKAFMNEQLEIKEEQLRQQAAGASNKQNLIVPGVQCYIPDKEEVWLLSEIVDYNDRRKEVTITAFLDSGDSEQRVVDLKNPDIIRAVAGPTATEVESLPIAILHDNPEGVEDMRLLRYLNEPSILFNLKQRFAASKPYTYTNDIVIAVNPYKWIDNLYGDHLHEQYLKKPRDSLPPHVYSTSTAAYNHMKTNEMNQSILVSGESGAGKTETTKIVMNHLASVAGGRKDKTIAKVIDVNPLLESFGNAKTTRNDNSSRFGKFTQLQFDGRGKLIGAKCETYLLEKSRVVSIAEGERNYHIFYQLLAGLPSRERKEFGLDPDCQYQYAGSSRRCRSLVWTTRKPHQGPDRCLDIFGFEDFVHNGFEQFCINYANEKLQQKFTTDVFKTVEDEYIREGLQWDHIKYQDNQGIVEVIEGKMGIIALMNDHLRQPRDTEEALVNKIRTNHQTKKGGGVNESIDFPKVKRTQFIINHYAGSVTYETVGFMEKHRDTLQKDLLDLIQLSPEESWLAVQDVAGAVDGQHQDHQLALRALYKPNSNKSPTEFNKRMIVEQLRSAGVIEAIRITRSGYPSRLTPKELATRYAIMFPPSMHSKDVRRTCSVFMTSIGRKSPLEYQMGKTLIYFKNGVMEELEAMKSDFMYYEARTIQRIVFGFLERRRLRNKIRAAIVLQSYAPWLETVQVDPVEPEYDQEEYDDGGQWVDEVDDIDDSDADEGFGDDPASIRAGRGRSIADRMESFKVAHSGRRGSVKRLNELSARAKSFMKPRSGSGSTSSSSGISLEDENSMLKIENRNLKYDLELMREQCIELQAIILEINKSRKSEICNQETETKAAGDGKEKNEDEHDDLNQVPGIEDATDPECNQFASLESADEFLKAELEQAPSSTSTTGTSSSVSSIFSVSSSDNKSDCVGKPPLSRVRVSKDNRSSYSPEKMPQSKYIARVQGQFATIPLLIVPKLLTHYAAYVLRTGPTLGSILQRIHLNDGDVSELDFSTLAQRNKRLEAEGCALVARSLSTNHTVRKLIIRDHAIGDDGAVALSKMLCNNTTLEYLDLYGNNIGDRGAESLAQALYGHDSLRRLCLRSNLISDRGATALAQAIRCNCTLKSLELVHNRVTKVGAQALLDALDVNFHLETLNLEVNDVPAFVASQLAAALARNRAESLILESHAAEKQAVKIVRRASGLDTEDEDDSDSEKEDEENWEDEDWKMTTVIASRVAS